MYSQSSTCKHSSCKLLQIRTGLASQTFTDVSTLQKQLLRLPHGPQLCCCALTVQRLAHTGAVLGAGAAGEVEMWRGARKQEAVHTVHWRQMCETHFVRHRKELDLGTSPGTKSIYKSGTYCIQLNSLGISINLVP